VVIRRGRLGPAAVVLALALGPAADAQGRDDVAFARATALARAGDCPGALAALAELSVPSAAALQLRGQCQIAAKDWPAALASLEEARRLDPALPGVELQLGVARFQMGDFAGASEALDRAEAGSANDPQYHLYRGLVLLQEARAAEAADALARARALVPARVEPGASYYEGLAWAHADDRAKAEESLDRVIQSAPGTPWAEEAARARAELRRAPGGRPAVWVFARGGFEYDDNVQLRGNEVFPQDDTQHDVRGVWVLHGGNQLAAGRDWAAGLTVTYYGSAHEDLEDFNEHYPVVGLWYDHRLDELTSARVSYEVGYSWFQGNPFVFTQQLRPSLYRDFGASGRTEVFASLYKYNYLYSVPLTPAGPGATQEAQDRNRDGLGASAGVEHRLPIPALDSELSGGLAYLHYSARGTEYDADGVSSWVGTATELPLDSVFRTTFGYAWLPFQHESTYPNTTTPTFENGDRSDDRWRVALELEKFFDERLSATLRWSYLNNHSNVDVFDYDREITGVYVTYRLQR
jgi:tetratricopeptide (TPR) repeat protein